MSSSSSSAAKVKTSRQLAMVRLPHQQAQVLEWDEDPIVTTTEEEIDSEDDARSLDVRSERYGAVAIQREVDNRSPDLLLTDMLDVEPFIAPSRSSSTSAARFTAPFPVKAVPVRPKAKWELEAELADYIAGEKMFYGPDWHIGMDKRPESPKPPIRQPIKPTRPSPSSSSSSSSAARRTAPPLQMEVKRMKSQQELEEEQAIYEAGEKLFYGHTESDRRPNNPYREPIKQTRPTSSSSSSSAARRTAPPLQMEVKRRNPLGDVVREPVRKALPLPSRPSSTAASAAVVSATTTRFATKSPAGTRISLSGLPEAVLSVLKTLGWDQTGYPAHLRNEVDWEHNMEDFLFDNHRLSVPGIPVRTASEIMLVRQQSSTGEVVYEVNHLHHQTPVRFQKVTFDDEAHSYVLQSGVLSQSPTGGRMYYILQYPNHIVSASKLAYYAFRKGGSYGAFVMGEAKHLRFRAMLTDYFDNCGMHRMDPVPLTSFLEARSNDRMLFDSYVMPGALRRLETESDYTKLTELEKTFLGVLIDPGAFTSGHLDPHALVLANLPGHISRLVMKHANVLLHNQRVVPDYSLLSSLPTALGTRMHKFLENCVNDVPDSDYATYDPLTFRCARRFYDDVLAGLKGADHVMFVEPSFGSYRHKVCGKLDLLLNLRGGGEYLGVDFKRSKSLLDELIKRDAPLGAGHVGGSPFSGAPRGRLYHVDGPLNWSDTLFDYAFQLGVYRKLIQLNHMSVRSCWYIILIHPMLVDDGCYRIVEVDIARTTVKFKRQDTGMTIEQLVDLAFAYKRHILEATLQTPPGATNL